MSRIAASVSLIVRSTIKADPVYLKKLEGIKNITVHLHTRITTLAGDPYLQRITITTEGQGDQNIEVDGVFIEVALTLRCYRNPLEIRVSGKRSDTGSEGGR